MCVRVGGRGLAAGFCPGGLRVGWIFSFEAHHVFLLPVIFAWFLVLFLLSSEVSIINDNLVDLLLIVPLFQLDLLV